MDAEVRAAVEGCTAAHRRLAETAAQVDDDDARRPSLLPGWTVGHVLTHLARNADSHVRMLEAALDVTAAEQYPGGYEQRRHDIEAGAARPAADLRAEIVATTATLEATWARMPAQGWAGHGLARGNEWPCRVMPFHRWREVEVHHADLGLGYSPADWPDEYVARELPVLLGTVPGRLGPADRRSLSAWLLGRRDQPVLTLEAWQASPAAYHAPLPASNLPGTERPQ